jgi:2-polyprenyl-3-methyl-5-hydroxy-6-metoxy-1,4-benzoquinol methylase
MVTTIDAPLQRGYEAEEFYAHLAADYDAMTGFEHRFVTERPFFRLLVERFDIRTAMDAGSGSGFHSLLLAQLGVAVTAVDASQAMLDQLSRHAEHLGVHVTPVRSTFQELDRTVDTRHDAVFCLGNSLSHLLTPADLDKSLRSFAAVLRPGGKLILQLLNYERILETRERVQSVKQTADTTFVRFYDYEGELIRFNVLKLEKKASGTLTHSLHSTLLRPIQRSHLVAALRGAGYSEIETFGGISMEEFVPGASKDLVVHALRRGEDDAGTT